MDDVVYTYRVGGGPNRHWFLVETLDPFPAWATLGQIEHIATHSRPDFTRWVVSSSGRVAACRTFERALKVQTRWAKQRQMTTGVLERIAVGRLAHRPSTEEQDGSLVHQALEDSCPNNS